MPRFRSGSSRITYRPIISYIHGKVQIAFARSFLAGSSFYPRSPDAPSLSQEETYALETVLNVCRRNSFNISKASGDILFVNNLSILHARDAYQNACQRGAVRHLLNIMLRDTAMAWEQPNDFRAELDQKFNIPPDKQLLTTTEEWEALMQGKLSQSNPVALGHLLLDAYKHD